MIREDEVEEVEIESPATTVVVRKPKKMKAKVKAKTNGKMKKAKTGKARKTRVMDPAKLDQFGFRKGSLKSRAALMYSAKRGATLAEVKEKLNSTQFNLIPELEGKGFKVKREQISGDHDRKVTRYHIAMR